MPVIVSVGYTGCKMKTSILQSKMKIYKFFQNIMGRITRGKTWKGIPYYTHSNQVFPISIVYAITVKFAVNST